MWPTAVTAAKTRTTQATATAVTIAATITKLTTTTTTTTTKISAQTSIVYPFSLTLILMICHDFINMVHTTRLPLEVYELTPSGIAASLSGLKHNTLIYSTIDHRLMDNNGNGNGDVNVNVDTNANTNIYGHNNDNRNQEWLSATVSGTIQTPITLGKVKHFPTIYDTDKHSTFLLSSSPPSSVSTKTSLTTATAIATATAAGTATIPSVAIYNGINRYNNILLNNNHNNQNNASIMRYGSNDTKDDNRKSRQMLNVHNLHHYVVTSSSSALNRPDNANHHDANNNDSNTNTLSSYGTVSNEFLPSSSSSSSSKATATAKAASYKFHANFYHNGDNSRNAVRILYQVGNTEDGLPVCAPNAVCSKIDLYDRPWLERQCRCPSIIHEMPPEIQIYQQHALHHTHHHAHTHAQHNSHQHSHQHQFHHYHQHLHANSHLHSSLSHQQHDRNPNDKIMRYTSGTNNDDNDNASSNNNNNNNNNANDDNYHNYFDRLNRHRHHHQHQHQGISHLYLNGHIDDIDINGSDMGSSSYNDKQFFEKLHLKKLMQHKHTNANLYENDYDNYGDRMITMMMMMKHKQTEDNSALPNSRELAMDFESDLPEYINAAISTDSDVKRKDLHPNLSTIHIRHLNGVEHNIQQQQQWLPKQQQQQQQTIYIPINNNNKIGGCPMSLDANDGHTVADKTRHYKLCQPVYNLPMCRHFRDYTWTLTTSAKMNTTEQVVHCRCPRGSVTYLTKREPLDDQGISFRYLFACSPVTHLRCQRKQPCKLFTVRKRQEFIDEVNINLLCQCPKGHHCPTHHTQAGILAGETFLDDNIQTYSGYCMAND